MFRTYRLPLAALLLMVLSLAAPAEPPERTHNITIEDYFSLAIIEEPVCSPDGRYVVYVERRWDERLDRRNADLWLFDTQTSQTRRLTFDDADDTSPAWSADGRTIYFASARKRGEEKDPPYNGKRQVWAMSLDGGEPQAITREPDGVGLFDFSTDRSTLYFARERKHHEPDFKELRDKYDSIEYGRGSHPVHEIWKLSLHSWRSERIADPGRYVHDLAVAPDGRRLALITAPDDRLITLEGKSTVDIIDVESGSLASLPDKLWRADAPSPFGWLENLTWSSDGGALAFTIGFDGYPSEVFVAEWAGRQPSVWRLNRPDESYVTGGLTWQRETRNLCLKADHRALSVIYRLSEVRGGKQGPAQRLSPADFVVDAFDLRRDGRIVAILSDTQIPQDLFLLGEDPGEGQPKRLTDINPQVATWKLPTIQRFTWKASDATEVEGILELPPDYEPGTRLPTIIELHGGPTACTYFQLRYWIYGRTLLAARGYALLSPNYRGSTGYGDKFLVELVGRENDVDVDDILTGVDALVERGIADPQRLGVMGWSNGGFLTNCLISRTDRFRAASSGAGVIDQFMQWALEDTPGHVINYMRGLPWEQREAYGLGSPSLRLHEIRTPTVIHVGAGDERVPAAHSRTLFRTLNDYTNVPTQLLVYPGQGHGLTKYKFRKAKLEWDVAWFERYLLEQASKPQTPEPQATGDGRGVSSAMP